MRKLNEDKVRDRIKKYFSIQELVDEPTYKKYRERAWRFLDYRLLYSLLIVREGINKPIIVNYDSKQQRGLRTILQPLVSRKYKDNILYLSPHLMGKAVDFHIKYMNADKVRKWILDNEKLFPFKIRLEDEVSWVHMDVVYEQHNPKVYLFKP